MIKKIVYASMVFAPIVALADSNAIVVTATSWAKGFNDIISILIPAFYGLAVIYFFYGLGKYLLAGASDPKAHDAGRQIMWWGLIALAIMGTLSGLINFLADSTGVPKTGTITLPVIPTSAR